MRYAGEYKWADIKAWPLTHLMHVDATLFEDGYELNLEARWDRTLERRVSRMWKLSQAVTAELERRRRVLAIERVRALGVEVERGHSPLLRGPNALLRAIQ